MRAQSDPVTARNTARKVDIGLFEHFQKNVQSDPGRRTERYLVVYQAVADPHDEEGEAGVGGGEVDHDGLLAGALCLVDGQQVGAEIRAESAAVPRGLLEFYFTSVLDFFVAKSTQVFTAISNSVSKLVTHFVSHDWL